MQYTGLKDMNGKEIYEGDILDCGYINPRSKEKIEKIYTIDYQEGAYYVRFIDKTPYGDTWLTFMHEYGVVIGSIYENPELLEGRKE